MVIMPQGVDSLPRVSIVESPIKYMNARSLGMRTIFPEISNRMKTRRKEETEMAKEAMEAVRSGQKMVVAEFNKIFQAFN